MKEKFLDIILCVIGSAAVLYGMINKNNLIFIIGIFLIIIGYIMLRKRLKKMFSSRE